MWHAWEMGESRKESSLKTETQMGGWDQNGSWGDLIGEVECM
jgi:hypothetical protein